MQRFRNFIYRQTNEQLLNTSEYKYKHPNNIPQFVSRILEEDIGSGDITANLIPADAIANAQVITRESATIAGSAWFNEVFKQLDPNIKIEWNVCDGDIVKENTMLCSLSGNARELLIGERSALNILQTLSATATLTQSYVDLVSHTKCKILDTRKTIPGLRDAQKYAVLCGSGTNHRIGLYDGILIKENHIMAAGSITAAIKEARKLSASIPIEVEVENLDELNEALDADTDIVLLDNMSPDTLKQAVAINRGRAKLEASGNVNKKTVTEIAETGVDFISIGELTKNIHAIDLSMRFQTT